MESYPVAVLLPESPESNQVPVLLVKKLTARVGVHHLLLLSARVGVHHLLHTDLRPLD
jgi:hypothetical protein